MMTQESRHTRKSNVLLYTGAGIVFGVYLPISLIWLFVSRDSETPSASAIVAKTYTIDRFSSHETQPSSMVTDVLTLTPLVPDSLLASFQKSPDDRDRSEVGKHASDSSAEASEINQQAHIASLTKSPSSQSKVRPAWWMSAPPQLTSLSEDELKRELKTSSEEFELYDHRLKVAGSYDSINQDVDAQKQVHQKEIRNHRQAAAKFASGPLQTETTLIQGSGHNVSARIESSTLTPRQRQAIHEASPKYEPLQDWRQSRSDLAGLPFLDGDDCRLDFEAANVLRRRSGTIGRLGTMPGDGDALTLSYLNNQKDWQAADVPALVQMLQIKSPLVRTKLTKLLTSIPDHTAAQALAHRALYDTNAKLRDAAITALSTRASDQYLSELIAGFRYPWPRVADHAAEALVKLNATDAIAPLEALLDAADPQAPFQTPEGSWAVHELVRVNHMKNCYLCHAPSLSRLDTVRGVVPSPYEPIPTAYYDDSDGYFVRADVTYLRQDFSVVHDVPDAAPWPDEQRFDYLVRERQISAREAKTLLSELSEDAPLYPQRNSVLYALHKLHSLKPR